MDLAEESVVRNQKTWIVLLSTYITILAKEFYCDLTITYRFYWSAY